MGLATIEPSEIGAREHSIHTSPSSDVYIAPFVSAGKSVVVKRTKITGPNDMKRFDKEVELLTACAHGSVIQVLGVLKVPPTYALVLPVYARGSLFTALHASGRTLSARAKLHVALDVAAAIAHVHEQGVLRARTPPHAAHHPRRAMTRCVRHLTQPLQRASALL
jgi:serine/threonine protein kinase